MMDPFFTKKFCDRCNSKLTVRTMSWFTEETICMDCADKEKKIRESLGVDKSIKLEGCGYIPKI